MTQGRFERLAPLTGVVFFALIVIAILVSGGETPGADAPAREIATFYNDHRDQTMLADLLGVIAGVFLIWFAASLRSVIWRAEGGEGRLATLAFAGGVLAAVGAWSVFGIDFAVADASDDVSAVVLKPLVALNNGFFLPLAGGLGLLMLASALAILRTRALPAVAGWLALVIGIVTLTPVGFFGVLASLIWVPVVGVMIYRKQEPLARA